MRVLLLCLLVAALGGCQIIYKLPTRQGNVLEPKELRKLKPGMTREQVRFVLGTPLAATPFRSDRWDYVGYYKSPRGEVTQRTVTAYFDGDELVRLDGVEEDEADDVLSRPDAEEIYDAEERDRAEARRATEENDPDVVLNPDTPRR